MKSASVQQLPQQWPEILRWVAAGEEVEVTQQDKVVARVVPPNGGPVSQPDFLARANATHNGKSAWDALSGTAGLEVTIPKAPEKVKRIDL